jgi:succinate dehydrogenase hydrophobic anchor subunit
VCVCVWCLCVCVCVVFLCVCVYVCVYVCVLINHIQYVSEMVKFQSLRTNFTKAKFALKILFITDIHGS